MTRVPDYMKRPVEVKLANLFCMPERIHDSDAGADLRSIEDVMLMPGETKLVDTGVAIKIPVGFVGLVFSRSSQGKVGVSLANSTGVIDSDYRGNIKVMLKNSSAESYEIKALNTRIAQLVIVPVMLATFVPFETTWDDTARSTGGFGSTGT